MSLVTKINSVLTVIATEIKSLRTGLGARPITFFYNGTSWPSRTVPSYYTVGWVIWDSGSYPSAPAPSGMLTNDYWDKASA
jgi:hypothetical protein